MSILKTVSALCIAAVISSCSTQNTYITASWKKPNTSLKKYDNVFIDVLSSNIAAKQQLEDALQQKFTESGIKSEKSIDAMPPDFESQNTKNKDAILGKIKASNADAILTVALIDEKDKQRYVPGGGYNPGFQYGFYNNYWGYYSGRYGYLYSPGYYTTDKVYYIETNLYDAGSEQLVWSTQSKTYNPGGLNGFVNGYTAAIDQSLIKNRLIGTQK